MLDQTYDPRLVSWTGGNEGFVGRWYKDPTGTGTIGFGFTWQDPIFRSWWLAKHGSKMQPGDTISKADALVLLQRLIDESYAPPVLKKLKASVGRITPHATAASIDMAYNCGARALSWSWFKSLLAGKVRDAANRYRVTATTSKGRRLPGLVRRRQEGAQILERNLWPAWVKAPRSIALKDLEAALPVWQLRKEDFWQGVSWLEELKFLKPGARNNMVALRAGILAFQQQHPQLDNDGILGRATLDQVQRVIDLKRKSTATGAAGSAGAGGGAVDAGTAASGYGDWIFIGSLVLTAAALAFLAWTYRDELKLTLKSFTLKGSGRKS